MLKSVGSAPTDLPPEWERLRTAALAMPECAEGIACKGTSLEARTVEVRGKAFLFLRPTELRFKVGASLARAADLAKDAASGVQAGAGGWVKIVRGAARPPAADVLGAWVAESYCAVAPKSLAAALGGAAAASGAASAAAKRSGPGQAAGAATKAKRPSSRK